MTRILKSRSSREPTGWKSMAPDQPRVCASCGEKIVLSGKAPLWFSTMQKLSWHAGCRLAAREAAK